ncbi:MAG TPA: outer-membrane lipoprotein carrier protein LolA [Pyrinomonadaceae bacterium]|nr:outer-membrane lipoprotein carrier protein LolA [Pyrinomonadaceae bacterium]
MNKVIRSFLFTSFVFSALLAASAISTNAQGPLGEILNRMDAHNKSLNFLKSSVTMVKVDAALGEANAETVQGNVHYIPKKGKTKMYARVDWVKPEENMIVVGDDYKIYRPTLKQGYQGKTSKAAKGNDRLAGPLGFLSMSREELKQNYKVVYIGEATVGGGAKTIHLQMTPITANSYKLADLWVDGNGMPVQAKVTSNNGDTTTILLSNFTKNGIIDYGVFSFSFPAGTKVIKS